MLLVALLSFASTAAAEEGLMSLRSAAMGDNVVGGAGANAALFHNPAGIAAVQMYALELGYNTQLKSNHHQIGLSIADSQTNPNIAGGFSYNFGFQKDKSRGKGPAHMQHDLRAAAALPVIQDALVFGVTAHYIFRNNMHATDDDRRLKDHGFTLDLGLMAKLGEKFFLGVSTQNLLQKKDLMEARNIRAGFAGIFGVFRLLGEYGADLEGKQTRHHAGGGVEVMIQSFALRGGFRHVTANDFERHENLLSLGAGFRSRSFGLDVAYRQHVQRRPDRFLGASLVLFL